MLSTDEDREHLCFLLTDIRERFGWVIANWAIMPNHHHLLLRLEEPNLDAGMHRMHGLFAQRWNGRNNGSGHVFFRRYTNVPLRRPGAPGRVSKYIDLNPVRAGLCLVPEEWPWGGYGAIVGKSPSRPFHEPREALDLIADPMESLGVKQLAYARAVRERLAEARRVSPAADTRPGLSEIVSPGDIESLRDAHDTWRYSTPAIAKHVGVSVATVHRWLREAPAQRRGAALRRWAETS